MAAECSNIAMVFAIGRVALLLLGVVAGTLCIFLGWSLYRDRVRSTSSGEMKFKGFIFSVKALGPGVFLALFGAFIVYSIVNQTLEISYSAEAERVPRSGPTADDQRRNSQFLMLVADPSPKSIAPTEQRMDQPKCPPCIVKRWSIKMQNGEQQISVAQFAEALQHSISALKKELAVASSSDDKALIRIRLQALEQLQLGLER